MNTDEHGLGAVASSAALTRLLKGRLLFLSVFISVHPWLVRFDGRFSD
jgi:hypothetical protein